jgi:simple sugar transport system ATP-binding protein
MTEERKTAVLEVRDVSLRFGAVVALDGVSLRVDEGEVVALLGDNGAGKSTLIKAISGMHRPDTGIIAVDGVPATIRRPIDAIRLGIETIHQDSSLALDLSVGRNLFLGREPTRASWLGAFAPLDVRRMEEPAQGLLERVGISKRLDPAASVARLSGGERQSIAIARAMHFLARVIILDEPTNNLGVEETYGVLAFIREVKARGGSILLVTHNIHHVMAVCDRAMVMRRGQVVAEHRVQETTVQRIEADIMGVSTPHAA